MTLTSEQLEAVERVRQQVGADEDDVYMKHDFNIHRWIVAWQDETDAVENLKRHLNIRRIMPLPPMMDEISESMELYAPVTFLGTNRKDDNKIVLLEQSGKIDINGLLDNIRYSAFMRNKFRMMEKLQQRVEREEERTEKQSGGLLIMDLKGLSFTPSLLTTIAGPYRILWGTLFEQYPQLIQQIIVINAPTFVNLLYQTCQPFIPADYKEKIIISSSSDEILRKHLDIDCIPTMYGGTLDFISIDDYQVPCCIHTPINPIPACVPITETLNDINIPAGEFTFQKYQWKHGDILDFYLHNGQEFTYFIYYSPEDTTNQDTWIEIFAGCERPSLKQVDHWTWTVPNNGFYYIRYGNEKAWLFSVRIRLAIKLRHNHEHLLQEPLSTF